MLTAWRIVRRKFADEAFTGEGAFLNGGRWNSPGRAVVYTSANSAVATLELLVNVPASLRLLNYVIVTCHFPEVLVQDLDVKALPRNWRDYPAPPRLQALGDAWIESRSSAVLQVPSAVAPFEFNYLLNPEHPDFRSIDFGQTRPFQLDYRLLT